MECSRVSERGGFLGVIETEGLEEGVSFSQSAVTHARDEARGVEIVG
jgi:hypothetical protein